MHKLGRREKTLEGGLADRNSRHAALHAANKVG